VHQSDPRKGFTYLSNVTPRTVGALCCTQGRSGKQCRERYHNHLDERINKNPWTEEEERIMSEAHRALGNR
jgi:Myb-like DNA-binding domain